MSAPPANAGALVGTRLGDYELVALLALGGTAEIYLARVGGHAGFEKYVVVKCLHDHLAYDPEFVQMFLDEARLGAQLDHSNIVQTLGLGEQDGRYYLVMEYVAGMSVALMARRAAERVAGARIPPPLVLGLAVQAAGGLHYAHERRAGAGQGAGSLNLVHRDISPQNLVVTFEGVVKIVDFGIAKAEERSTATRSGTIKGKFAYMSPEQCVAKHVDRRTDVFALGMVIHELLTGRRLFKRGSTYETYQAILECKVPPPSAVNHELDPGLDAVIMNALAKDPNRRYQTAEAFGEAISAYLHRGGRHAGASAISTFIEQYFNPEIADHGDRMRELLEGRAAGAGGWDDDEAEEISGNALVEDDAEGAEGAEGAALGSDDPFPAGASGFEDGPTGGGPGEDGGTPVESTRIEMNPLDRLAELDAQVRRTGGFPVPEMPTTIAATGPSAVARAATRQTMPAPVVASPPAVIVAPPPVIDAPMAPPTPAPPTPAPAPPAARNPGPPQPVFAAAKPGGSIFGNGAARPGASMFGGAAGAATNRPVTPAPSAAAAAPLKIASLFGGNTPAPSGRRPQAGAQAAGGAVPAPAPPPATAPHAPDRTRTPAPAARGGVFGPSVVPTVIAEPEPTPASRSATAAPSAATMSIDLLEVIADLGNNQQPGPATSMEPSMGAAGGPMPQPGYGQAMPYGTPPGTPSSADSMPYLEQTHLPAHLIGLPPVDVYPQWDGTFQHPRQGMPPWLLTVILLGAVGLVTVVAILIARAVT